MATKSRSNKVTIVLIGTKGSGKSSTGNSILGEEIFTVFVGTKNGTDDIQKGETKCCETEITVIDTPGVRELKDLEKNLTNLNVPETTVYAIVIAIGRYTTLDKHMLEEIHTNYNILQRTIMIFTRRKELNTYDNENEGTLDRWLGSVQTLSGFIADHKIQYRAFENKDEDSRSKSVQVKDVIDLCNEMSHVRGTNDSNYNNSIITVDYNEMKRFFGEKGAEFFIEKIKSNGKTS